MTLHIERNAWDKTKFCQPYQGWSPRGDAPQPNRILIHTTNGRVGSSFNGECRFLAESKAVSAHYIVGKLPGQIARFLIPQIHVAWHAGATIEGWGNTETIGIECHFTPGEQWTAVQREQLSLLVLDLCFLYPIGDLRTEMSTHRAVAIPAGRKIDPSGWDDIDFVYWCEALECRRSHVGILS